MSFENIIVAHLNAWNSPGGPAREQAIADIYSDDVFVGEPAVALTGHTGVEAAIAALQEQLPGTVITRTGPTQTSQDLVTYAWTLGPSEGPALASGRDVLIIRDGKVASLYVIIDA
ncbi:nuclear transport factor 2 family protein [Mycolicibacter arupensis]|uniref:nuclear transport factor 2 family protein n=1 Tax=Mycolicibacter arupensis TaxID=342002 RepID=UPI003B3AF9BE